MLLWKFVNTNYPSSLKINIYDKFTGFIGSEYQAKTANFGYYTGTIG